MEATDQFSLRGKVFHTIRENILSGCYKYQEELRESTLGKELGVSRTPVREAFQSLAAEGLLELRMNRGAVVAAIDEKFIRDHFEVRILLESEAVGRAARFRMDTAPLEQLQQWAEEHRKDMTGEQYRDYNQRFHIALWKAAGNDKLYQLLSSLWNGPSSATRERDRTHEALSIQEHRQLLESVRAGEENRARQLMDGHIGRSMQNILSSFRLAHERKNSEGK